MRRRSRWFLIALLLIVGAAGLYLLNQRYDLGTWATEGRESGLAWLRSIPLWMYLLAFAVLPALGFPLTLFYLTAPGVVGGPSGLYGILAAWGCLGVNMTLHYWAIRWCSQGWLERFLARRGVPLDKMRAERQGRLIALLRISPLPYALQNITLAAAGVDFRPYILYSWPIQGSIGLSIMLLGESFFSGGLKTAFLGIGLFLLVWLLLPIIRRRLGGSPAVAPAPIPEAPSELSR